MEKVYSYSPNRINRYDFFMSWAGQVQYVFVLCDRKIDFGQCLCCWDHAHEKIAQGIRDNNDKKSWPIVFCGTYSEYNEKLGINKTFSDMSEEERGATEKLVAQMVPYAISFLDREEEEKRKKDIVIRLLGEHRYCDAKEYCRIFNLNYESIISIHIRR